MKTPLRIEIFLANEVHGLAGDGLVDLMKEWLARTPYGEALMEVVRSPDGDETVARLQDEDRVLEVRAHHDRGSSSHRVWLESRTWVRPELPAPGVFWGLGAVIAAIGFLITALLLGPWIGPLILGLVGSALLAVLIGHLAQRAVTARQIRVATDAAGGQLPASTLLEQLAAVLREDQRVREVQST